MLDATTVMGTVLIYIALLFAVALWVERRSTSPGRRPGHPLVYAISLCVYCTSWTFYGSVGKAATSGLLYATIYLGPALMLIFGTVVFQRLVRLKEEQHVTSIADFIASRYHHSNSLGVVATLIALVGTIPYVAVQFEALIGTFRLISVPEERGLAGLINGNVGITLVLLMIVFTIVFGVRRLDPTERHTGMVAALVVECVVKLVAFLTVGAFVTYVLNDGFADILQKTEAIRSDTFGHTPWATWMTYTILAMGAFVFLPRQFHIAIVENANESHLRTARWVTPLYLGLISLFVIPIALSGLMLGHSAQAADSFVLGLPLEAGSKWLSLFVFIGGFSAGTGMIMISSVTVATMMTNHILVPIVHRVSWMGGLRRRLLMCRWVAVALFICAGYWFATSVGESYMLVNMGMMSFAAVFQFAPVVLGGLFWRRGTRMGALAGLSAGFAVWAYTLILPAFVRSGWASNSLLEYGPFGLSWLRPEQLLGISLFDNLTHSLCWSMLFNVGCFLLVSRFFRGGEAEDQMAAAYVGIAASAEHKRGPKSGEAVVSVAEKRRLVEDLFARYYSGDEARSKTQQCLDAMTISEDQSISILTFAQLQNQIVRLLSGALGTSAAHQAVSQAGLLSDGERRQLSTAYAEILADLRLSPEELRQRVDFHKEREAFLAEQSERLEREVRERTIELSTIIESNPVGIVVADEDTLAIVRANDNVVRMSEYAREDLIGHSLNEILLSGDEGHVLADQSRTWSQCAECHLLTANKKRVPILKTSARITFGGRRCYLVTLTDISDRKELESQLAHAQKLESIGQLAAGIAHEINTPIQYVGDNIKFLSDSINDLLGLIGAYHGLLAGWEETEAHRSDPARKVEELERSADLAFLRDEIPKAITQGLDGVARVSQIVLAMKGFSHPGQEEMSPENLNKAIETTITVSRSEWKYVADVITDLDPKLPLVPCYLGEFNQVMLNLIVNAAHAIEDGRGQEDAPKGTINISTRRDGGWVEIRVADTGIGIPDAYRSRVFEHFFTTKEVGRGTGQGLSIAYSVITKKHGGTISFETQEGKGTTFVIRLPLGLSDDDVVTKVGGEMDGRV